MIDFRVRVNEGNGDTHIYTNATTIEVSEDIVRVTYGDGETEIHNASIVDSITIDKNL